MPKNLSVKYYQEKKERLQKKKNIVKNKHLSKEQKRKK